MTGGGDQIAFSGSIPERYDRYLGDTLFDPYALDLAARLPRSARRLLELACGTGIATRRLMEAMPGGATLTATDLSEAMVDYARAHLAAHPPLELRTADCAALPFGAASFDAAICQFGVMFVPDKALAFREARRVLVPGGTFLFNVWDSLRFNPATRIAQEVIAALHPADPPRFYDIPFGFSNAETIRGLLDDAGFTDLSIEFVSKRSRSPSAHDYAMGLVAGTPMATGIQDRGSLSLERVIEAVGAAIAAEYGAGAIDAPMRALVVSARAAP